MSGRFYYYKMTVDGGGAPCVHRGLLSLAICKPLLRQTAEEGDVVIGLAANRIDDGNRIIYVARIGKALRDGAYYRDKRYWRRPDCIYRCAAGKWRQIRNAFHKKKDIDRDLGKKREHASVLLSREFRYFGRTEVKLDWAEYPALRRKVDRLLRGHRVRHSLAVEAELRRLTDGLFRRYRKKVLGRPTDAKKGRCNQDDAAPLGRC